MVPALASAFDLEVTLLGRITARSARVCPAFRLGILSRRLRAGFPPTRLEARGTVPARTFAIWRRLLKISLASPPFRNRLGLSWLSYSPPGVCSHIVRAFAESPRWSNPGSACCQAEAPHASRVERTRLAASPGPTDGILTRFVCRNRYRFRQWNKSLALIPPTRPRSFEQGMSASPLLAFDAQRANARSPLHCSGGLNNNAIG